MKELPEGRSLRSAKFMISPLPPVPENEANEETKEEAKEEAKEETK